MAKITREEFLHEFRSKHEDWACDAPPEHIKEPSGQRVRSGWVVEQPLHTYFNWHMNRADKRIRELEARVAWLEKCLAPQIAECQR